MLGCKVAAVTAMMLAYGCAGVGVVDSPDPLAKLNDAENLFSEKNRPVPAELLIQEAIVIYRNRDDSHGLGNANREYGDLLESQAVVRWEASSLSEKFFRIRS